jgi:hypothetical protein
MCGFIARYWYVGQKKSIRRGGEKPKPKLECKVSYLTAEITGSELTISYSSSNWKACPKNWNTGLCGRNRQMCGVAISKGKEWK